MRQSKSSTFYHSIAKWIFLTSNLVLFLNNFFECPLLPPSSYSKKDSELILHLPLTILNVSIKSLLTLLVSNFIKFKRFNLSSYCNPSIPWTNLVALRWTPSGGHLASLRRAVRTCMLHGSVTSDDCFSLNNKLTVVIILLLLCLTAFRETENPQPVATPISNEMIQISRSYQRLQNDLLLVSLSTISMNGSCCRNYYSPSRNGPATKVFEQRCPKTDPSYCFSIVWDYSWNRFSVVDATFVHPVCSTK